MGYYLENFFLSALCQDLPISLMITGILDEHSRLVFKETHQSVAKSAIVEALSHEAVYLK